MIEHILMHAMKDIVKILPFLFCAFLLTESLERLSAEYVEQALGRLRKAGPAIAALAGCVPQCGFSVLTAKLYGNGIVSLGTLFSVFIATSDEALLILLTNPQHRADILTLLAAKLVIAVTAGYIVDLVFRTKRAKADNRRGGCCVCSECGLGILKSSLFHTFSLSLYLYLSTIFLNLCIEIIGEGLLSKILLGGTVFQPALAALIGLIPNCTSSVILAKLYLRGAVSFASVIAGLCSGTGAGLMVLFKVNGNWKENAKILFMLYSIAVLAGMVLTLIK